MARSGGLREDSSRSLRSLWQKIWARTRRRCAPARARDRGLYDDMERGWHRGPAAFRRNGQRCVGRWLSRHGPCRGLLDPFRSPKVTSAVEMQHSPTVTCSTLTAQNSPTGPSFSGIDRKSTRLNSSHQIISYAVFCLKKKKNVTTSELTISTYRPTV